MLNKVRAYIQNNSLPSEGLFIVALSGGADSVALIRIMKALGYSIHAAHCNFKLRGKESERDEAFCENLCREQDIPFHRIHFDTREYAELHHISIEMAARELRYSYFERLRVAIDATDIAVAHHRDDNIETLFLNLIRGTGIHGIEGMKPRSGHIIRPLLCVSREDIISYLGSIHQTYITDSSNLVADVQRNKLRLNILPLLKSVNPAAMENIQQSMELFSQAIKVYDAAMAQSTAACVTCQKPCTISVSLLMQQPSPESTLFEILRPYGVPSELVRNIFGAITAPSGKLWQWNNYTCAKDRDCLIVDVIPEPVPEHLIPETGNYNFGNYTLCLQEEQEITTPSRDPWNATMDSSKLSFPLTIRQVRAGDSFLPYGMKGRKLVSDYLTDVKANYFEKQRQMVLVDAEGDIIWLIGRRVAQKVSITPDTINILSVRYTNE